MWLQSEIRVFNYFGGYGISKVVGDKSLTFYSGWDSSNLWKQFHEYTILPTGKTFNESVVTSGEIRRFR